MENMRNVKMPASGVGKLAQVLVIGGAAVYGAANSLFNVEGGHRYVFPWCGCVTTTALL